MSVGVDAIRRPRERGPRFVACPYSSQVATEGELATLRDAFADLDRALDPAALLAHQEAMAELTPVASAKLHSFELLELAPGDLVLDVGCGSGDDVAALAASVPHRPCSRRGPEPAGDRARRNAAGTRARDLRWLTPASCRFATRASRAAGRSALYSTCKRPADDAVRV